MTRTQTLQAIVLKRFDLGEADRVLTVYSKELGKVSVIAKGVRRINSRKAGSVEIGNVVKLFVAEGKNFYILSEVEVLRSYQRWKGNLVILKYGYHVLELLDVLTVERQEDPEVFMLALRVLDLLNTKPRQIFIRAFEVKMLAHLGYLSISDEDYAQSSVLGYSFLDEESLEVLKRLHGMSFEEIGKLEIREKESMQLEQFLTFRIEKVIEKELKSKQFFE